MQLRLRYLRHLGYTALGFLGAWVALYTCTLLISTSALHISVELATWVSHQVSFAAVYFYAKTHTFI